MGRHADTLARRVRHGLNHLLRGGDPLPARLEGCARADEAFGPRVVNLFETLNRKLADDLGPTCQVGHSDFMVPGLDRDQLRVVWDHHVRPVLAEYFAAHPQRLAGYDLDVLMGEKGRRARSAAG